MIKNERQFRITKANAARFRKSLEELDGHCHEAPSDVLRIAQREAIVSQLEELDSQLAEYVALRSGQCRILQVDSLAELPEILVRARIASGLNQRELADKLGLKEQQIQRYEAAGYLSASVDRMLHVAEALGIEVKKDVFLNIGRNEAEHLLARLEVAGVGRQFVRDRLLPPEASTSLENGGSYMYGVVATLSRVAERVFGWNSMELFGDGALTFRPRAFSTARYKVPKNADERVLAAYTVYAHYIAMTVLGVVDSPMESSIPNDSHSLRVGIQARYGTLSLETALHYSWDAGIPVIPLRDEGRFHGACWRSGGKSVIVLKQRTRSQARWLFDLIHELRHTRQDLDETDFMVVEQAPNLMDPDDHNEIEANQYAGDVVLEGRAEELVKECVKDASNRVEFLKRAVVRVATRENVSVGQLANYLAFRLTLQGQNWWGTAANLQALDTDPWAIARDVLLARLDLSRLGRFDRDLLVRSLMPELA